jgi:hypothetical protein
MNKFLTFFNPVFAYIDTGKIFRKPFIWLYGIIAILNAVLPFIVLYKMIDFFKFLEGKQIFGVILLWIVILGAGWFSFQLWWNRMPKVGNLTSANDDFVVTPAYAHLLQTLGEWIGCYIAIVGSIAALLAWLFIGESAVEILGLLGINFGGVLGLGAAGIIIAPVYGFLILIAFRFVAELSRALASIANNTKK